MWVLLISILWVTNGASGKEKSWLHILLLYVNWMNYLSIRYSLIVTFFSIISLHKIHKWLDPRRAPMAGRWTLVAANAPGLLSKNIDIMQLLNARKSCKKPQHLSLNVGEWRFCEFVNFMISWGVFVFLGCWHTVSYLWFVCIIREWPLGMTLSW